MVKVDNTNHYVGEKLTIEGTGSRWKGSTFQAVVVDVDNKDNTVKVQFQDSGFKRFPKDEFQKLIKPFETDPHIFDSKEYEWASDVFSPLQGLKTDFHHYEDEIEAAIKKKDFLLAQKIKNEMEAKRKEENERSYLQTQLVIAIQKQSFLEADKLVKQIEGLKEGKKDTPEKKNTQSFSEILKKAGNRALGGGLSGAAAMVIQVSTLMWMRTIMNYQYRHGTSTREAAAKLYAEGGVLRFYKGYVPALFQGPLSRFGDTAANVGVLALLDSFDGTAKLPVGVKTLFASAGAAIFRIFLMPIDTLKTTMQVEGANGITLLKGKYAVGGPSIFFYGAIGAAAATFVGHYPWFATYNYLQEYIPTPQEKLKKYARNAGIGFAASLVSDTCSNSIRVLKTYRQTSSEKVSYVDAAKNIIEKDGIMGLFGRGLKTRLATNGCQGMMFSVAWKHFDDLMKAKKNE